MIKYPFDPFELLRKKKSLKKELCRKKMTEKKIAILGGSTFSEVMDMMELFLLDVGIKPIFYQSDYNRYYEESIFVGSTLKSFSPDVIYLHTSNVNILKYPTRCDSIKTTSRLVASEVKRYKSIWDSLDKSFKCAVIQNNFELPYYRPLSNLDAYDYRGRVFFIHELNRRFAFEAMKRKNLYLNDINYLSSWLGLERWYDKSFWYSYKYAMSYEAIPHLAHSVSSIIGALYGRKKKCLSLDLDNTLWGGVIGEEGLGGIQIGKETPEAEAYSDFQAYIKALQDRGTLLTVCSKNEEKQAKLGFTHPDSLLKVTDFSDIQANWSPKSINLRKTAKKLNIGTESIVFVDDNAAERQDILFSESGVAVPDMGTDVVKYINILDKANYFETVSLSEEDLMRTSLYKNEEARKKKSKKFKNYAEFLKSLEMSAEIKPFKAIYLERITQLVNKTNQFNLTTKRYTQPEITHMAEDASYLTLYGRLEDNVGDNGLVTVLSGRLENKDLHLDLWLMSCRVFNRGMEAAMLDCLIKEAQLKKIKRIYGYFIPTERNNIVRDFYGSMGFKYLEKKRGAVVWEYLIPRKYKKRNSLIKVNP